ncbi:MAG: endonuclease/exonuclease/phosphatase family protein [Granulosicoccus sp.]
MIRRRFLPQGFTADDELQVMGCPKTGGLGPEIRCLLWNILKARRRKWEEDFAFLAADRNLVMLQEAVFNAPSDHLFTGSERYEWVMARSFRDPLSRIEHGIKTGSTCKAVQRHFYLSPHSEPLLQTQKLLLATVYPLSSGNEHLLVLNMHAINFVTVRKYADQLDQLGQALALHKGPVILGGDFNTWNPSRLLYFKRVAATAGLVEAAMERKSKLAHMNQHLDHLFYRGLELRSVESLNRYQSSDHAPIKATFVYRPFG